MSRVDEALRRAVAGAGVEPVGPSRSGAALFESAWPAEPREDRTEDEGPPQPRPAESMLFEHETPSSVRAFALDWQERLASGPKGNPALVEQFRRLAGVLYHAQLANNIRTLMVTSAAPGDGKTLTAVNLALVLSESYRRRVLLVDADLRRPSIGNLVDLGSDMGLSQALRSQVERKLALVSVTPTLTLLPAGQALPDPIGDLTSPRMRRILDEAAARFDWVILDAPPIGRPADASLLAAMVDGILFVVRAGRTQCPIVQKSVEVLGRNRMLGVVLNDVERMPVDGYPRYDDDGGELPAQT